MELDVRALVSAIEAQDVDAATAMLRRYAATTERGALTPLRRAHDQYGTPLVTLAIRLNQPAVLDALLDCGCACQENEPTEQEGDDYDVYRGSSPLCQAMQLRHDDCARVLVAHGASVDAPSRHDRTDYTPVHSAVLYGAHGAFLRDEALGASLAIDARDAADYTPLFLATLYVAADTARRLLAAGADPRATAANNVTPLHVAAMNMLMAFAALYLDDCAVDVDARDAFGNTPLLEATFAGQYEMRRVACWDSHATVASMVRLLLDHRADIEACNRDGHTAIVGAVWNGVTDAVLVLLAGGASVRRANLRGETVLHVAALSPAPLPTAVWEALLRAGADADAHDREGRTFHDVWLARGKAPAELEAIDALMKSLRETDASYTT